jgi:hypothetical protein
MSCSVSSAYSLNCKSSVGGIKSLYIFSDKIEGVTYSGSGDTQQVSTITGTGNLVEFSLYRFGSNFQEAMAADPAQGTVVYTQTINAMFREYTAQLRNQFSLLAKNGHVQAIVRTNTDEYYAFGLNFDGGDATAITTHSGTALADRFGSDVVLTFLQKDPASFVAVTNNDLEAALDGITLIAA